MEGPGFTGRRQVVQYKISSLQAQLSTLDVRRRFELAARCFLSSLCEIAAASLPYRPISRAR